MHVFVLVSVYVSENVTVFVCMCVLVSVFKCISLCWCLYICVGEVWSEHHSQNLVLSVNNEDTMCHTLVIKYSEE